MSKIKNAWGTLTEEQKENLEKEYRALNAWDEEQRRKRKEELIAQGKWIEHGLDANQEYFADIIEERKRRFEALQKKYGYR